MYLAKTHTDIPSCTGQTPGKGQAVLYDFDGDTLIEGKTVTCLNWADEAVEASTKVMLAWIDGRWFVVSASS